jgi:hypothetical protein
MRAEKYGNWQFLQYLPAECQGSRHSEGSFLRCDGDAFAGTRINRGFGRRKNVLPNPCSWGAGIFPTQAKRKVNAVHPASEILLMKLFYPLKVHLRRTRCQSARRVERSAVFPRTIGPGRQLDRSLLRTGKRVCSTSMPVAPGEKQAGFSSNRVVFGAKRALLPSKQPPFREKPACATSK